MSDIRTQWHDHGDEGVIVTREQNVGAILDDIAARRNEGLHGASDFKHVMRIPSVVVEHYCNVRGITLAEFIRNPEHAKQMANSPEFSLLRIAPGAL